MTTLINTLILAQMQNRTLGYVRKDRAVCYACAPKTLKFWTPITATGVYTCHKCKKGF